MSCRKSVFLWNEEELWTWRSRELEQTMPYLSEGEGGAGIYMFISPTSCLSGLMTLNHSGSLPAASALHCCSESARDSRVTGNSATEMPSTAGVVAKGPIIFGFGNYLRFHRLDCLI